MGSLGQPRPTQTVSLSAEALEAERAFVEKVSHDYPDLGSPTEHAIRRAAVNMIRGFLSPGASILELGVADGYMSGLLAPLAARHVIVDATTFPITRLPQNVEFCRSLFEEFEPDEKFDLVVMSLVLEHVLDPVAVMARGRGWLKPETGRVVAIVPNMRAQSRLLARAMGIVRELDDLTPNDVAHGHRRCYDRVSFDRDVEASGGEIMLRGGLLLKPFATFQMDRMIKEEVIGREQLDGLEALGAEYPDLCAAIYAIFR